MFTNNIPGINGGPSGTGYTGNQRPNVTGQSCQADGDLPEQILNPAAFTLNGFKLGTFGTAGRGICTGPDYSQVDLSFYKNIRLGARVKAQLRFEIFNIFNRVNFLSNQLNIQFNPAAVTFDTGNAADGDARSQASAASRATSASRATPATRGRPSSASSCSSRPRTGLVRAPRAFGPGAFSFGGSGLES